MIITQPYYQNYHILRLFDIVMIQEYWLNDKLQMECQIIHVVLEGNMLWIVQKY